MDVALGSHAALTSEHQTTQSAARAWFFVTGFSGFASMNGPLLLGIFMLNPLHNIVHVLVGALLIAGGLASITVSRRVNTTVGAVYLLVFALGLALQDSTANILASNGGWPVAPRMAEGLVV